MDAKRALRRVVIVVGIALAGVFAVASRTGPCPLCWSGWSGAPHARAATVQTPAGSTVTLSVDGMTCASCTVAVKTVLTRLDGVLDAKVTKSSGQAVVRYDESKVTPQQMAEAVTKAGYPTRVAS